MAVLSDLKALNDGNWSCHSKAGSELKLSTLGPQILHSGGLLRSSPQEYVCLVSGGFPMFSRVRFSN